MIYDYVIIGGGPGGLSLASLLPGNNILIEKEKTLGGCHKVIWDNGYFTEHGPRIYGTAYQNAMSILAQMGINWDDHFVHYDFQFLSIGLGEITGTMQPWETMYLVFEFLKQSISGGLKTPSLDKPLSEINKVDDTTTVGEWMDNKGFTDKSKNMIDRICRMTDGADSSRYLLTSFLQLVNQDFFYSFQQPNKPMDQLFNLWEKRITSKKYDINNPITCEIAKGEEVIEVSKNSQVCIIYTDRRIISSKNVIFAMPPQYISQIIKQSSYNPFSDRFLSYAEQTQYLQYISLTFHFSRHYKLEHLWGVAKDSKWGIVFIKLDDYMIDTFPGDMFTIAVTKIDVPGLNGKTASECSDTEIQEEVWQEMNLLFHFPDKPVIKIYKGNDQAWVLTKHGYGECTGKDNISCPDNIGPNFYAVSCHVGESPYSFTSFESAVCNAIWLVNRLTGKNTPIKTLWTLDLVLRIILVLLVLCIFIWFVIYKK